jgi:hypothetical protein
MMRSLYRLKQRAVSLRAQGARAGSLSAQLLADHAAAQSRGAASWRAVRVSGRSKPWFGRCGTDQRQPVGRGSHRVSSLFPSWMSLGPRYMAWPPSHAKPCVRVAARQRRRAAARQRRRGKREAQPYRSAQGVPPAAREGRLTHRFEGDARAQAGLCENHGHGHAAKRLVGHVPGAIPRLELHGARQHRVQLRLCQVVDVQEVRGRRAGRAAAAPRRNGGESGGRGLRALRARWRDSATTGAAPRRAEARHGSRWLPHWCVHQAATDRPNAKHGAGRGEAL